MRLKAVSLICALTFLAGCGAASGVSSGMNARSGYKTIESIEQGRDRYAAESVDFRGSAFELSESGIDFIVQTQDRCQEDVHYKDKQRTRYPASQFDMGCIVWWESPLGCDGPWLGTSLLNTGLDGLAGLTVLGVTAMAAGFDLDRSPAEWQERRTKILNTTGAVIGLDLAAGAFAASSLRRTKKRTKPTSVVCSEWRDEPVFGGSTVAHFQYEEPSLSDSSSEEVGADVDVGANDSDEWICANKARVKVLLQYSEDVALSRLPPPTNLMRAERCLDEIGVTKSSIERFIASHKPAFENEEVQEHVGAAAADLTDGMQSHALVPVMSRGSRFRLDATLLGEALLERAIDSAFFLDEQIDAPALKLKVDFSRDRDAVALPGMGETWFAWPAEDIAPFTAAWHCAGLATQTGAKHFSTWSPAQAGELLSGLDSLCAETAASALEQMCERSELEAKSYILQAQNGTANDVSYQRCPQ